MIEGTRKKSKRQDRYEAYKNENSVSDKGKQWSEGNDKKDDWSGRVEQSDPGNKFKF